MVHIPLDDNDQLDERYIQALMLSRVIKRILKKRANLELSCNPVFIEKPIAEFMNRLKVSSLDKFNETTYISSINFYKDRASLAKHEALGALIIYVGESYLTELVKRLEYPDVDEDDPEAMLDAIGTFCNLIAGNFKAGLTQLGYIELVMSHFSGYENKVLLGVEFSPDQSWMYEIEFEVGGEKRIVAEFSMAPIPLDT
ncbi:MAG: chemotaxis protein CheX [Candidatus Omnitrophica bacterium]|nr:chemotaxis protein CheX [Candidatus Omnitrophota bacterium]